MRLRRIQILRLPGIDPGFTVEGMGDGLQLIVGPNASGKSSLIRALHALLEPGRRMTGTVHLEADIDTATGPMQVVRIGDRVTWYRDGAPADPPALPPPHLLDCYALQVEGLTDPGATDAEIGRALVRELAGGYDLAALTAQRGPFHIKRNHGETEARTLEQARSQWRERRQEHEALIADEQRLADLETAYRAAEQARHEAEQLRQAAELAAARAELEQIDDRLAHFPAEMNRLHGDELQRLEQEEAALARLRTEQEKLAEAERAATRQLTETRLPEAAPDAETLQRHRQLLRELSERERECRQAEEDIAAARQRQQELAEALGVPEPAAVRIDPTALRTLEEQLEPYQRAEAELTALDRELARLSDPDHPRLPRAETVRTGRRELIHWLSARKPPRPGILGGTAGVLGMAAPPTLVGTLLWLEPQWQWHPGWVAAGLGATAALSYAASTVLRAPQADALRDAARRRYPTELPQPSAWEHDPVGTCLEQLDTLLHAAERREQHSQRAAEQQRCKRELQRLREDLSRRARQLGGDGNRLAASTLHYLQSLRDWNQAAAERAEAEARREARQGEAERLRTEVSGFLTSWHSLPPDGSDDVEALIAAVDGLANRAQQRTEALRQHQDVERWRADLLRQVDERRAAIEQLFARAGLPDGDRDTLRQRLEQRPDWQQLQEHRHQWQAEAQAARRALADANELLQRAEQTSAETLHAEASDRLARAGDAQQISETIGSIRQRIHYVQQTRPLEHTRAEIQQAGDALAERLDEALIACAGRWLVDDVRQEHTSERRPDALRRAEGWLHRFTDYRYTLRFLPDAEGNGRFLAHDQHAGADRSLAELSTGTRMQLLLAVRVAFALEAERGREPLPLFLDEALTTTDRERFSAVAEALATLAEEDRRQVFYLSAQAAEPQLWHQVGIDPPVIDLAEVRRLARGSASAEGLALPPRPTPAEPQDHTAASYGAAIGAPWIDPWQDIGQVHLFHLLRDDLERLHRILNAGFEYLGPLRGLLSSDAARTLFTEEEANDLRVRLVVAEAWQEAYTIGRGFPIDRATLAAATPIAGSTLRDDVAQLAETHGGDAAAILEALQNKAVSGFRTRKIGELRDWLEQHGYLDPRPPSRREDRLQRALVAAGGAIHEGTVTTSQVRGWVDQLEAGLAPEGDGAAATRALATSTQRGTAEAPS
ncbi:hypothetical protein [Halorhodospira halophila]|uniref:Rad50/SbcC-type AAA domain-containing protein n=1 Tax=Halorhodospira halophila (strain DSM 244 / SL1) TaxID=349124 RepID=A1WXR3_HALHL|nr:hypothetical protein [Halorhodospira halophila]ABM62475.1 conserved hypothetical protein [Halorhodospira halophila SL1]MBK1728154.1 hypothetical protein [Halorhodospira halophila]